jgi:hypothetical protein
LKFLFAQNQRVAGGSGQAMFRRELNRAFRTGALAFGTKQAAAQIELRTPLSSTVMASVGQTSAQTRQPSGHFAESICGRPRSRSGSTGGSFGKTDRAVFLMSACEKSFQHESFH